MKRSPKDDWDIKDVLTVADAIGLVSKPPTKGSHYKFASPLVGGVWVVPARKPILPEYIRKFVDFAELHIAALREQSENEQ